MRSSCCSKGEFVYTCRDLEAARSACVHSPVEVRVGEIERLRADMPHGNHIRCPDVCRRHIRQCSLGDLAWLDANEPENLLERAVSKLFAGGVVLQNTNISTS